MGKQTCNLKLLYLKHHVLYSWKWWHLWRSPSFFFWPTFEHLGVITGFGHLAAPSSYFEVEATPGEGKWAWERKFLSRTVYPDVSLQNSLCPVSPRISETPVGPNWRTSWPPLGRCPPPTSPRRGNDFSVKVDYNIFMMNTCAFLLLLSVQIYADGIEGPTGKSDAREDLKKYCKEVFTPARTLN